MKRFIKIITVTLVLIIPLSVSAFAYEGNIDQYSQEFDFSRVFDALDNETLSVLEEIGITEISYNSVFSVTPQKIFNALFNIFANSVKTPLKFLCVAFGILMLTSLVNSLVKEGESISLVGGAALSLSLAVPVAAAVTDAFSVLESLMLFTTAFTGVFCALVSSSGNITMGVSYAALTVFADSFFSGVLVNLSQPVVNTMCSLGFLSCFDVYSFTGKLTGFIKKIYVFVLSFAATVFSALVTLKGVLSQGADTLSSRGIRFVIGRSLPVVGGAVSETYTTLVSSLMLIKNTVGVFGIITVAVFILPTLSELLSWILVLEISSASASFFGSEKVTGTLQVLKDCLVLLVSTIVIITTVFIVCVGVAITVKGGAL